MQCYKHRAIVQRTDIFKLIGSEIFCPRWEIPWDIDHPHWRRALVRYPWLVDDKVDTESTFEEGIFGVENPTLVIDWGPFCLENCQEGLKVTIE